MGNESINGKIGNFGEIRFKSDRLWHLVRIKFDHSITQAEEYLQLTESSMPHANAATKRWAQSSELLDRQRFIEGE